MPADAAPVSLGDRVEWVDALRGFALLGIVVANLRSAMLQFVLPDGGVWLGPWPALNVAFDAFETALIQGKFYSIFSFLFELGFSIQMRRAAKSGGNFGTHAAIHLRNRTLVNQAETRNEKAPHSTKEASGR